MTVVVRPDILSSLEAMRQDAEQRIAMLDRFRAVKALEQTMADFPGLDDLTRSLSEIRDRVRAQLDETREFRALRSIERIMPELTEVLALLGYTPAIEAPPAASEPVDPAGSASDIIEEAGASEAGLSSGGFEITAIDSTGETGFVTGAERAGDGSIPGTGEGPDAQVRSRSEAVPPALDAEPVPSLADSVAQLMAQSMSPPREVPPAPHPPERSDAPLAQAERAA